MNGIATSFIISLSYNTHLNTFPVLYLLILTFSIDVDFITLFVVQLNNPGFECF